VEVTGATPVLVLVLVLVLVHVDLSLLVVTVVRPVDRPAGPP
jgi:hypothetical protein